MLADFDIEGLLKLGVVALFVIGSALGGIIKNLRAKREKDSQEGPILGEAEPLAPPQRSQQPRHPVARPMPLRPSPTTDRPVAKAYPLPGVAPQGQQPDWLEVASGAAGLAPPPARPAATPSPAAPRSEPAYRRSAERPSPPPPGPARQSAGAGQQRPAKATPRRTPKTASPQKAARKRKKTLSEQMRARDAESVIVAEQISDELDTIHHPTRVSLRHAIVLSELLGRPLALRQPDDAL